MRGTVKLTKAHVEALGALSEWRKGAWIPTASLNHDGITTATLRALHSADLVERQPTRERIFWQINGAGRSALRSALEQSK